MDTCIVESGLFKKKICGRPAVTHCLNCEGALCAEHAVAEVTATGKRSGKFVCHECKLALKENEKNLAAVQRKAPEKKDPATAKAVAPPPAKAPTAPPVPPAGQAASGGLEFTPSGGDKKKPE
jgi:hypothetical protein